MKNSLFHATLDFLLVHHNQECQYLHIRPTSFYFLFQLNICLSYRWLTSMLNRIFWEYLFVITFASYISCLFAQDKTIEISIKSIVIVFNSTDHGLLIHKSFYPCAFWNKHFCRSNILNPTSSLFVHDNTSNIRLETRTSKVRLSSVEEI